LKASVQVKNPRVIGRGEFVNSDRADYKKVGQGSRQSKGAIAKCDGEDVGCKPEVASKNRDEGVERGIENGRLKVGSDKGEDNDRGGSEEIDGGVVTGGENDSE